MNQIKYIIALLVLSTFASCVNNNEKKEFSENGTNNDTLQYEMKTVERDTIIHRQKELDTTIITIIYPYFDNKSELGKMLNDTILECISFWGEEGKKYSSVSQYANQFIENYKEYAADDSGFPVFPWYGQTKIQVLNNNADILSFQLTRESYTGGAHGSYYVLFDNYDRKTNKAITVDEILSNKYDKELLRIGEYYFKEKRGISQKESLQENGAFEAGWLDENQKGGFYFNDNFTIDKEALTFYYNEYEVSAYVFGPTELRIPLEKIRPYLKNSFGF